MNSRPTIDEIDKLHADGQMVAAMNWYDRVLSASARTQAVMPFACVPEIEFCAPVEKQFDLKVYFCSTLSTASAVSFTRKLKRSEEQKFTFIEKDFEYTWLYCYVLESAR